MFVHLESSLRPEKGIRAGQIGQAGQVNYSASKAGLIGAAKALYFPTISLTAALGTASSELSTCCPSPVCWRWCSATAMPRGILDDPELFCDRQAVLGATYSREATTFRVFAPTARAVNVVLYDTAMQPGSTLGGLSLLMKGETLPPDTHWEGTPARKAQQG